MSKKGKILVIDDDPTITRLLEKRLSDLGYVIMTTNNGEEGLSLVRSFNPHLIILDIIMPKMDGYSFVLEFNKTNDVKSTPIIVLSAKDHMQNIFQVEGINDYIIKPFDIEELLKKIDKRLTSRVKKILVIDDEEDIVTLVQNRLTSCGYDVLIANNGLEGLELAKAERPDLIVLDNMMPKLDGFHVCRMLKFDRKYKNIPIIMFTALDSEANRKLGKEVQADAYLPKPFNPNALLTTIKELLWD